MSRTNSEVVGQAERLARKDRRQLSDTISAVGDDFKRLGNRTYLAADDDDVEWPAAEAIPYEVWQATRTAKEAHDALVVAIEEAKRAYRQRVLQWLLAETEGKNNA